MTSNAYFMFAHLKSSLELEVPRLSLFARKCECKNGGTRMNGQFLSKDNTVIMYSVESSLVFWFNRKTLPGKQTVYKCIGDGFNGAHFALCRIFDETTSCSVVCMIVNGIACISAINQNVIPIEIFRSIHLAFGEWIEQTLHVPFSNDRRGAQVLAEKKIKFSWNHSTFNEIEFFLEQRICTLQNSDLNRWCSSIVGRLWIHFRIVW